MDKDRVVIAGGGIAGLEAALRLERQGFGVTLVEPRESMFFYPLAHRIVQGYPVENSTIDYSQKFEHRKINHIQARMTDLKAENHEIETEKGSIEYDHLLLAFGSDYSGFWPEKTVNPTRPEELRKISEMEEGSKVIVVGGGATGVEMAAGLVENSFEVTLVHDGSRLLPRMQEKASQKALDQLEHTGVDVRLETRVEEIGEGAKTSKDSLGFDSIIWAGGNRFRDDLPEEVSDPEEGIPVDEFQRTTLQDVYAAGDCVHYEGKQDRAIHAMVEAKTAAANIYREEKGRKLKSRNIKMSPSLIHTSKRSAILQAGSFTISGIFPFLMERVGVEKRYMWLRRYFL